MYNNKTLAVVVPAFNEENFISKVIKGLPAIIDRIYVVDDASSDATSDIAKKVAADTLLPVIILRHPINMGVGKSVTDGYKRSIEDKIDIAIVMAGDNQMDPANITKLVDPIINCEADYTVGDRLSDRTNTKTMPVWRKFGNQILRWITVIAAGNTNIADPQNGYTAISREALITVNLDDIYPRYGYVNDLLVKLSAAKARIRFIPMKAVYGDEKSKIRYWHYIPTVSWLLLKDFIWRISRKHTPITDRQPSVNRVR